MTESSEYNFVLLDLELQSSLDQWKQSPNEEQSSLHLNDTLTKIKGFNRKIDSRIWHNSRIYFPGKHRLRYKSKD